MKKYTYIWLMLLISMSDSVSSLCQIPENINVKDTVFKVDYITPMYEIFGINLLINRFDYHVSGREWANVSPSSWWININRGFKTDGDAFPTNWIGHPLHGSLAFNAARTNNLGFWQSVPYVAGHTLLWEFFAEIEPPSSIDFYTTTFGGIYLGEIIYRLTNYVWNHPSNLNHPFVGNLVGGLINPVAAINRYAFNKKIPFSNQSLTPISLAIYAGTNHPADKLFKDMNGIGPTMNFELQYGELFDIKKSTFKPFDYFRMNVWINFLKNQTTQNKAIYFNVSSDAIIWGTKLTNLPYKTEIISLSQHYDFIHNDRFKLGTIVLTGDWTVQKTYEKWRFYSATKLGVVIFGSGNSELVVPVMPEVFTNFERDYMYGQGFMVEAEMAANFKKKGTLALNYNHFLIYSNQDPKGSENIDLIRFRYLVPLREKVTFGIQYDYYNRNADYYNSIGYTINYNGQQEVRFLFGYSLQ